MKTNRVERKRNNPLALLVGILLVLAIVGAGAALGFSRLRALYLEQCVVTDLARQVDVSSGKMVKADVIMEILGLRVGANLATIDFVARRKELLARIPNLRAVRITRQLPDHVTVATEERVPIARMGFRGRRSETGRVVDTEGMVFTWQRGTQALPIIRETQPPGTTAGKTIEGRVRAALRLIEAAQDPQFSELAILEVDTAPHDYLLATLGNYAKLKIAWDGMDDPTPASTADLVHRLTNLRDAMRSKVVPGAVIWNATISDRIFADTQEKL